MNYDRLLTAVLDALCNPMIKLRNTFPITYSPETETRCKNFRWSTCVLVYFSWLLDHVIYLKLRRQCKAEQIHKITTIFRTIMSVIFLICSALYTSYSLLSLKYIT